MRANHILTIAILVTAFTLNAKAQTVNNSGSLVEPEDKGTKYAPIDYGPGPGASPDTTLPAAEALTAAEAAAPAAGPAARTNGVFGASVTWSLVPIHTVLLPDGRVLSYGIRTAGQLNYDVWDPRQGTTAAAHMVLPNTTGTSTFCSGQSIIPSTGEVLMTGGTTVLNGIGNTGVNQTTIFDPQSNLMRPAGSMVYKRWYGTIVPLANGDKLVLGGREDTTVPNPQPADWNYATTPEVFTLGGTWRVLPGARSDAAFGGPPGVNWSYPRGYQMPNDPTKVFVLAHSGAMFYVTPAGAGTITRLAQTTLPSDNRLPTAMFAPGKLISVRSNRKVVVVGLNGPQPAITTTADLSQLRYFSNATILPNGKVLVTGGSAVPNQLVGVASAVEIWDPATGQWTLGAKAAKPRLYHSTALLLPDGSVLTAGGGLPGPVTNMNGEIYFPPYLYDATGQPAVRPQLLAAPNSLVLQNDKQFGATVGNGDQISRVTLLHTGSVTHANNVEQRFQDLAFTQAGQNLQITSPANPTYTIPGYYLLFVINNNGVPSVAKIIKLK